MLGGWLGSTTAFMMKPDCGHTLLLLSCCMPKLWPVAHAWELPNQTSEEAQRTHFVRGDSSVEVHVGEGDLLDAGRLRAIAHHTDTSVAQRRRLEQVTCCMREASSEHNEHSSSGSSCVVRRSAPLNRWHESCAFVLEGCCREATATSEKERAPGFQQPSAHRLPQRELAEQLVDRDFPSRADGALVALALLDHRLVRVLVNEVDLCCPQIASESGELQRSRR